MTMDMDDSREMEFTPLEYVIGLGTQGNHVLFENDRIREAFRKKEKELADLGSDLVLQVREAINQIFSIPGVERQKEFIASLPQEVEDVLIFLYFQMIERTMLVSNRQLH